MLLVVTMFHSYSLRWLLLALLTGAVYVLCTWGMWRSRPSPRSGSQA